MKRHVLCLLLMLIMSINLVSCDNYEHEDATYITEKGTEMMQTWIDKNMPDAEIVECSAFINNIAYTRQEYLFDYVIGCLKHNGENIFFAMDILTEEVYFQNDQNINNELNEVALNYLCDTLEIDTNIADISLNCYVLAPFHDENHELEAYQMNYGFDFGLPANVDDLVSFVRNPNNRPLLYTQSNIMLSDEIDLSKFDFATFDTISKECGMLFSELNLENSTQTAKFVNKDWYTSAVLYEYGQWIEKEDIYMKGYIHVRDEQRNDLTQEISVSDRYFDASNDFVFEKTDSGYMYCLPNENWKEGFYLYAHEGAEILEYNYNYYFCSDIDSITNDSFKYNEEDAIELAREKLSNGDYILISKKQGTSYYFTHGGKLERQ